MIEIEAEQLVYGSFAGRDRGYEVLARSAGCSPALTADVVAACRRFGQPPSSEAARPGFFAVMLPGGSWAVVGVAPQGNDDRGRPGALAFHALIVPPRDYRRAGADPFAFAAAHRADWGVDTPSVLPTARCAVEPTPAAAPPLDLRGRRIVAALKGRRRVALEAAGPIDDLARSTWAHLAVGVRRRASVATWAFSNENHFDLVAFPRLAGIALDPIYVAPASLDAPEPEPEPQPARPPRARVVDVPGAVVVAGVGMVAVVAVALAWSAGRGWFRRPVELPPPAEAVAEAPPAPADAASVRAGLEALASRFAAFDLGPSGDPGAFLSLLADALHYHGRTLTASERAEIARDPNPDRARALLWDDQIRRFRDDQPWPGDFAALPVEGQLRAVARSFHLDPTPPADQIPAALIAALTRPGAVWPTPLAARFPALSDYARFLGKLPRLDDPPPPETDR